MAFAFNSGDKIVDDLWLVSFSNKQLELSFWNWENMTILISTFLRH